MAKIISLTTYRAQREKRIKEETPATDLYDLWRQQQASMDDLIGRILERMAEEVDVRDIRKAWETHQQRMSRALEDVFHS